MYLPIERNKKHLNLIENIPFSPYICTIFIPLDYFFKRCKRGHTQALKTFVNHYFLTKEGHPHFTNLHIKKIPLPSTKKSIIHEETF